MEQITEYWRSTAVPKYISAVTQQLEEDETNPENFDGNGTSDEALCKNALQISKQNEKSQSVIHNDV